MFCQEPAHLSTKHMLRYGVKVEYIWFDICIDWLKNSIQISRDHTKSWNLVNIFTIEISQTFDGFVQFFNSLISSGSAMCEKEKTNGHHMFIVPCTMVLCCVRMLCCIWWEVKYSTYICSILYTSRVLVPSVY